MEEMQADRILIASNFVIRPQILIILVPKNGGFIPHTDCR